MDINTIILQLSNKIDSIKTKEHSMKSNLQKFSFMFGQLRYHCLPQLKKSISSSFQDYHKYNVKNFIQVCANYQHQIQQQKGYYEYEIEQLKSQIHRQYKVIGLMKQEVQDLMILLNQQHNHRINEQEEYRNQLNKNQSSKLKYLDDSIHKNSSNLNQYKKSSCQQGKKMNIKLDLRSNMIGQLQTIEEEDTQRTFVSNGDINELNNQQFKQFNQQMQQFKQFQKEQQKLKSVSHSQQKNKTNFIRIDEHQQNSFVQTYQNVQAYYSQKKLKQQQKLEHSIKQKKEQEISIKSQMEKRQSIKKHQNITLSPNFPRYLSQRNHIQNSQKGQQIVWSQQDQNNSINDFQSDNQFGDITTKQHLRDQFIQQNENEKWSKKGVFEYIDYKQGNQQNKQDSSRNLKMQQPLQIDYSDRYNNRQNQMCSESTQNKNKSSLSNSQMKQMNALQYLQAMFNNEDKSRKNSRVSYNSNCNHSQRQLKNIDCNAPHSLNQHNNRKLTNNNCKLQYLMTDDQSNTIGSQKKKSVIKSSTHKDKGKQNVQFYKKQKEFKSKKNSEIFQTVKEFTQNQNQNKTKQFLQQFRKTFNKCLSAIQVTKKYSTKLIKDKSASKIQNNFQSDFLPSPACTEQQFFHSEETINNQDQKSISPQSNCSPKKVRSLQATFGKNKKSIEKQRKNFQNKKPFLKKGKAKNVVNECTYPESLTDNKHHSSESVNVMLKDLQSHNKFLVGSKQLELKYEGQKKQGLRNGNGILHYSNGLWYQGQFKNNMRNGYGILRFNHIQLYNGEWKDDQLHGQGKIRNCAIINKKKTSQNTSSSNNLSSQLGKWISYCGYFRNNRFEGQGTLYLQGGQKFMGSFISGNANGQGTLYRKNGQVQMGVWKHNIFMQIF